MTRQSVLIQRETIKTINQPIIENILLSIKCLFIDHWPRLRLLIVSNISAISQPTWPALSRLLERKAGLFSKFPWEIILERITTTVSQLSVSHLSWGNVGWRPSDRWRPGPHLRPPGCWSRPPPGPRLSGLPQAQPQPGWLPRLQLALLLPRVSGSLATLPGKQRSFDRLVTLTLLGGSPTNRIIILYFYSSL